MITCTRYHDFCAGHRVAGHENKCANLHGHNYRIHFTCAMEDHNPLDALGRVIDFSVIKEKLCDWLERNWDHKFLAWEQDEFMRVVENAVGTLPAIEDDEIYHPATMLFDESICWVPFNPTAENMAIYLVEVVGPRQLEGTDVELIKVTIDETRKCSATYELEKQ